MKYKLNLSERFSLLQILPAESNAVTLRSIMKLKEEIGVTDEESKEFEIKPLPNGSISWNKKGAEEKEFEVGEIVEEEIKKALKDLDSKKKLKEIYVSLYEKFIEPTKQKE